MMSSTYDFLNLMNEDEVPFSPGSPCSRCLTMTTTPEGLRRLLSIDGYAHYENRKDLENSARNGCSVCAMLFMHTSSQNRIGRISATFQGRRCEEPIGKEHPLIHANIDELWVTGASMDIPISCFTDLHDPAATVLPVKPLMIPVVGQVISEKVKQKLEDCRGGKHKECSRSDMQPVLPRRVIRIREDGLNVQTRIYCSKPGESAPYVALSYCWGGPQALTLTTNTLTSYTSSLPTNLLPQTLTDAILVTKSLGFQYLWVDALCIIQDDVKDKDIEISSMGEIYNQATLTLAAASCSSVNNGFLEERPLERCSLPLSLPNSATGTLWMRSDSKEAFNEPLDKRAWTFQESVLSPRVLYYASKELIWKCQTEFAEPILKTHDIYWSQGPETTFRLPREAFSAASLSAAESRDLVDAQSDAWTMAIEDYSNRSISFESDRLPALAGIASELQKIWNDTYVAGMWKKTLVRQLPWIRRPMDDSDDVEVVLRPEVRVPSWSWASAAGRVMFEVAGEEEAELLACSVTPLRPEAPLGEVLEGEVTLKAPVLAELDESCFPWMDRGQAEIRSIQGDTRVVIIGWDSAERRKCLGLLLEPVGGGKYRRIGVFEGGESMWKTWKDSGKEREILTII